MRCLRWQLWCHHCAGHHVHWCAPTVLPGTWYANFVAKTRPLALISAEKKPPSMAIALICATFKLPKGIPCGTMPIVCEVHSIKSNILRDQCSCTPEDECVCEKPYSFSKSQLMWWSLILISCFSLCFCEILFMSLSNLRFQRVQASHT